MAREAIRAAYRAYLDRTAGAVRHPRDTFRAGWQAAGWDKIAQLVVREAYDRGYKQGCEDHAKGSVSVSIGLQSASPAEPGSRPG